MMWVDLKRRISRREAKIILECMWYLIDEYGIVTLADFYNLADSNVIEYADYKKDGDHYPELEYR